MIIADATFWNVHWIWLAVPLALIVSVVYKTTKIDEVKPLILQSLKLFVYIVLGMAAVGAVLYFLPDIWPMAEVKP